MNGYVKIIIVFNFDSGKRFKAKSSTINRTLARHTETTHQADFESFRDKRAVFANTL